MKAKNTKKTLLCSALSLLLCFAMLIGSTFAWFTDKVEVTGNRIVAGNLDVEMDYYDVKAGAWVDVEEIPANSPSFFRDVNGEDILWEPGAVAYATFKVANEGTLALKYTLKTIAENFNTVAGTNKSLKDVLTVCVPTTVDTTSREALIAATNGAEKFDDFGFTGEVLTEGASKEFTVVIYWAPSAVDNEYNLKDGKNSSDGKALWIDLDFSLVANQATVENDSFDNQYDKMATIDNEAELLEALAGDYDLIKLGGNVELTGSVVIPAGKTVTIDLAGFSIKQVTECTATYSMIANKGNLTILDSVGNGKISFTDTGVGGGSSWATYTIHNTGTLVVNGGTIEHLGDQQGNAINAIFTYSGNTTINGGNIVCPYSRSVRQWHGTLTINDGKFDGQVWIQAAGDCTTTINGGNFKPGTKGNDSSSVYVTYGSHNVALSVTGGNFATKLGSDKKVKGTVTGGTFGADPSAYVADDYSAVKNSDGTWTVCKGLVLSAYNDAELTQALATIKAESKYWNTAEPVMVKLAANTAYSANHTINQYPEWNGVAGGGTTANNMISVENANYTNITFVGSEGTKFTGNVYLEGNGYSGGGFANHKGATTFEKITFDGTNSADEEDAADSIVMYVKSGASNVTFEECIFENATHVTLGSSGSGNGVGKIVVKKCTFNDGGCLSGAFATLDVSGTTVTAANNGFINKSTAGAVTVENSNITAGKYFLRTATGGSGVHLTVKSTAVTMYESEGAKDLVKFRGSSESATFTGCTIAAGYTTAGVDANSILTIN